jgi:cell division protein FtsB
MRALKAKSFLLALYASFMGFCALSLVFGPSGLIEQTRLEERRIVMQGRLEELRAEADKLASRLADLGGDKESLVAEAARIGYARPGEGRVFVEGRPDALVERRRLEIVPSPEAAGAVGKELGLGAIAIGFLVFVLAESFARKRGVDARCARREGAKAPVATPS